MVKKKADKSFKATLLAVQKEMSKPTMTKSARLREWLVNLISEKVFRDRPVYRDEGERMSIMARSF